MKPIPIPLSAESLLGEKLLAVVRSDGCLGSIPRSLLLHPLGFPSAGAELETVYHHIPVGQAMRHPSAHGILVYDVETGRLKRLIPRRLVDDAPYDRIRDLIAVYLAFASFLDESDARKKSAGHIGGFLAIFWKREERMLRELLLPRPVR